MERMSENELRELRVVVAEAMGWRNARVEDWREERYGQGCWSTTVVADFRDGERCEVPDYTGDDAQIGPMLEHFRALWETSNACQFWDIKSYKDSWGVDIRNHHSVRVGNGEAATLELAICLAIREYVRNKDV